MTAYKISCNHSFAVLAYKDSSFLSPCLVSLHNQSLKSKIFITTSTPSPYISGIASQFGVEVFITDTGKGIAHDWNFALEKATTKYVTLAHQDDLYMAGYVEEFLKAAEQFENTLITFCDYSEIVGGNERSYTLLLGIKKLMLAFFMPFKNNIHNQYWKKYLLSSGNPIAAPSVMYNLDKLTGFQFTTDFSINMDWDAWLRMAGMEGRFVYVKNVLMKHRIHPDSATTAGLKNNARQNEDITMFKRFWPGFLASILAKIYAKSYQSNKS